MPKPSRNSFYFFMVEFKEEQRKKGIKYANMKEVADAAGPVWNTLVPPVRAKYEAMAKAEKQKQNVPENKFTSTGVSLADLERQEREKCEAEQYERQDIQNIVKLKSLDNSIVTEDFYVMDVNFYCKCGPGYVIGEMTILRFNLKEGVKDHYHELINPGRIPLGYNFDVKLGCKEFALEMPDESERRANYKQILGNIIDYLKQKDPHAKTLPPIFTMPEKVAPVVYFIQHICRSAAEDDRIFRIYKLHTLFFTLIEASKRREEDGLQKESMALVLLNTDKFWYNPGLGCQHHKEKDKEVECTTSRTKRWAFTILDMACERAGIEPVPGRHVPRDFDVDTIPPMKEDTCTRTVGVAGAASINSSMLNATSSLADSSLDNLSRRLALVRRPAQTDDAQVPARYAGRGRGTEKKEELQSPPVRMPSSGYYLSAPPDVSRMLALVRRPALTDYAQVLARYAGRGRGIVTEDFYVMDVNFYCKCGPGYVIGEMTILRFNLKEGVKDHYHELINPGRIPVGYAHDVKLGCKEFALEMPDESERRNYVQIQSNTLQILANTLRNLGNIIDYLKQKDPHAKTLPPIFTMPEKVAPVVDYIQQICRSAGEDDSIFRIYKLDDLFFTLIEASKRREEDGLQKESMALVLLKTDKFKYNPGLGCEHHKEKDKEVECTTSRTKRWAFTILDMACERAGIEPLPGRHVPRDFDVDTIPPMKEDTCTRTVGVAGAASINSSMLNATSSLADSSLDSTEKKEELQNPPIRKPYSGSLRRLLALAHARRPAQTDDAQFPALYAGRGRGRHANGNRINDN